MEKKGAIICLQKYSTEYRTPQPDGDDSPVCLGYFNRIEVREIGTFRQYVREASKHQADRACSRKQLLLRCRDDLHDEIVIRKEDPEKKGKIPFCSKYADEEYMLGCCSVFNVRDGECRKDTVRGDGCITRKDLSVELYKQIESIRTDEKSFRFAIMESLGAEDLCLVVLTNHYEYISDVIAAVQSFVCKKSRKECESTKNDQCRSCIIDNGHSVLMIDRSRKPDTDMWGKTQASIHFSLRSVAGLRYLRSVEHVLNTSGTLRDGERVTLDGCSGEYDAIMRCPARLVTEYLFGESGYFAPGNSEYQRSVYQSETFVYPIGTGDATDRQALAVGQELVEDKDKLTQVVKDAVDELKKLFHYDHDDPDFDYIELPLWRLLKDYWSFASFPLNKELKVDLRIQLIASVNAIVSEAQKYTRERKTDKFLESYDKIVDALRSSMQAGSQQDRWYFGEQKSYIQNVESYYKIMHCYYGMIKDMISLIYHIERGNDEEQPLLIPLLSFGVKTIIKSDSFNCSVNGKPARLICIRLPYQALANLPRYLGPLAHELFHYSAPAKRSERNELMIKVLLRVAVTEFVSMLAEDKESREGGDYSKQFFACGDHYRGVFDLDPLVDRAYGDIKTSIQKHRKKIGELKLNEIRDFILLKCLDYPLSRTDGEAEKFYYTIWKSLRHNVQKYMNSPQEDGRDLASHAIWASIFALGDERKQVPEAELKQHYQDVTKTITVEQILEFRRLLLNTFKAMEECPADIFDLEVVMAQKNAEQKIRQFLWQINGARRDATLVRSVGADNQEEWPQMGQTTKILSNHIRIAMILDYYMTCQKKGSLNEILADWAPETGRYMLSLGKVRQGFIRDYQDVMKRFEGLLTENRKICHQIAVRIRHLLADESCRRIMKRLSEMYEQYYRLLEQRQRSPEEDPEVNYQKHLFDLCCNLIDTYQMQAPLDIKSHTSVGIGSDRSAPDCGQECLEYVAHGSGDLSACLIGAMNWLKIRHEIPNLWFRGDARKHVDAPMCSTLHFSRMFHAELVRATADWTDQIGDLPTADAEITVLNPCLFNLAMELLADEQDAQLNLKAYLEASHLPQCSELHPGQVHPDSFPYPCAITPESPQNPSCGLVRFGADSDDEPTDRVLALELLQREYQDKYRTLQNDSETGRFFRDQPCIPFLFRIKLNHLHHVDFVTHLRAVGLRS